MAIRYSLYGKYSSHTDMAWTARDMSEPLTVFGLSGDISEHKPPKIYEPTGLEYTHTIYVEQDGSTTRVNYGPHVLIGAAVRIFVSELVELKEASRVLLNES